MIELLRQHGARTGKSHKEMLALYETLKAEASRKRLQGHQRMIFMNEQLESIPDKKEPESLPIKEIAVEAEPAMEEQPEEKGKKTKARNK